MEVVELIDAAVSLNNKPHSKHRVAPVVADTKTDIHVHHTNNHLNNWYYTETQETNESTKRLIINLESYEMYTLISCPSHNWPVSNYMNTWHLSFSGALGSQPIRQLK
jgi:hypothetical protein